MKVVVKVIKYIVFTILLLLAGLFISVFIQTKVNPDRIPSMFGYKPFIVLSGSMESELYKGDLAIVKNVDANTLEEKDIIAFRDKDNYVVTHRIVEIKDNNGTKEFITKGDNNSNDDVSKSLDKSEDSLDKVEGKYISKISGFGNVLLVMQKPITLIIILVIIVVIGVLWIMIGNSKLSIDERKELELLRKEKNTKN